MNPSFSSVSMLWHRGVLFSAFAAALLALPSSASTWWTANGDRTSWSDGANWNTGAPPPETDAAKFEHQGNGKYLFRLTPPVDYRGVIIVDDEWVGEVGSGTRKRFPITLELTVLDGATWTVQGPGTIVATPGIAERLTEQFTGVIEVPAGRSFTAPATLSSSVRFTGAGELTLSTAAQVENAWAFAGKVILPGSVTPESLSLLQNADVILPDGAELALTQSLVGYTGLEDLPGFNDVGSWSFNGTRFVDGPNPGGPDAGAHEYSALPPYATSEGDLVLTDDPGQTHSAFLDRRFKLSDDWGVSFTWKPELPVDSRWKQYGWNQTWSGYFGFYLQKEGPDNVVVGTTASPVMTKNSYGFTIYCYRDAGAQHFELTGQIGYAFDDGVRESALSGLEFDKPVDFRISCRAGVLVVTMSQDGKSATFHSDLSSVIANSGEGMYLGFAGASDNWESNTGTIPWARHVVSDFKGWCLTKYSAGWSLLPDQSKFYPFTSQTWLMNSFYEGVTNRDDAAEVNSDGSFQIVPAQNNAGGLVTCRQVVDVSKPVKVSFDYRFEETPGGNPGSAEAVDFAFQRLALDDSALKDIWNKWAGRYVGQVSEWGQGWGFNWQFWANGTIQLKRIYSRDFNHNSPFVTIVEPHAGKLVPRPHSTAHFDVVYDAKGSLRVHGTVTPDDPTVGGSEAEFVQTVSDEVLEEFKTAMSGRCRMTFAGYSAIADNDCYQSTAIRNVTVSELVDNAAPALSCSLTVPASASAAVKLQSVKDDGDKPTASVETLSLGTGAAFSISPETSGGVAVLEAKRIETEGLATVATAGGAALRVGEYAPAGGKEEPLVVKGSVEFPESLVVHMPAEWTASKPVGEHRLFDISEAVAKTLPKTVILLDHEGSAPTREYKVRISASEIAVDFIAPGTVILFR